MLNANVNAEKDITKLLELRNLVYENGIDLNILDREQILFEHISSKIVGQIVAKASHDDQKVFISQCAAIIV